MADPDSSPAVVRIRSKAEKDFNSFYFSKLSEVVAGPKEDRVSAPKPRIEPRPEPEPEPEATGCDLSRFAEMLSPYYLCFDLKKSFKGRLVSPMLNYFWKTHTKSTNCHLIQLMAA